MFTETQMMKKTLTWATANFYFLMNLIEFPLANFWKQNFFFAWPNNQFLEYFYHFKQTLKFCNFHPWQSKKIFYFLLATIFMRIFNIFEKLCIYQKKYLQNKTYILVKLIFILQLTKNWWIFKTKYHKSNLSQCCQMVTMVPS